MGIRNYALSILGCNFDEIDAYIQSSRIDQPLRSILDKLRNPLIGIPNPCPNFFK